jgi:hypothetical protein
VISLFLFFSTMHDSPGFWLFFVFGFVWHSQRPPSQSVANNNNNNNNNQNPSTEISGGAWGGIVSAILVLIIVILIIIIIQRRKRPQPIRVDEWERDPNILTRGRVLINGRCSRILTGMGLSGHPFCCCCLFLFVFIAMLE